MESSLFIIKPEGLLFRATIVSQIAEVGLTIRRTVMMRLGEKHIAAIYPNLPPDLLQATRDFMLCASCEVGHVTAENAVHRLMEVAGHATNPSDCLPGTIRAKYGCKIPEKVGQALYFKNAIHRSKDADEAARDLTLFADLWRGII